MSALFNHAWRYDFFDRNPNSLGQAKLRKYVRPAAEKDRHREEDRLAHVPLPIPHSLRSVGAEFEVMQELMRHSSVRSTLNVYTQL
jgi:hypothetical protein